MLFHFLTNDSFGLVFPRVVACRPIASASAAAGVDVGSALSLYLPPSLPISCGGLLLCCCLFNLVIVVFKWSAALVHAILGITSSATAMVPPAHSTSCYRCCLLFSVLCHSPLVAIFFCMLFLEEHSGCCHSLEMNGFPTIVDCCVGKWTDHERPRMRYWNFWEPKWRMGLLFSR